MLIGRAAERARLESVLEAGRSGKSASLVVHGHAGVGKTALLQHAIDRADGFILLRIQALHVESELPFVGIADLLKPIVHLLDRIPKPQAEALAGALALGPPTPGDRFAAAAATLSLLGAAAAKAPVLAVVDDAHWLDVPSREAIVFAGRRLSTESVVLLVAMRDRAWLSKSGLDTMPIEGLSTPAAMELVDRARPGTAHAVRDRLVAESGGNPLALLETLGSLSDQQVKGSVPLALPIPIGPRIEQAFGAKIRRLAPATRRAMLVAAASDSGDLYEVDRALAAAGLEVGDLEDAERRGLVVLRDGRIEFKHPLVRSATYQLHGPDEQRAAHRALATAIDSSHPDRIAWHLAGAASAPDEAIAAALEAVGAEAKARRGHAAAAKALDLAGRLSPADEDRARRLLAAAEAAFLGNDAERSLAILDELLERADEPTTHADLQLMRSMTLMVRQPPAETHRLLVDEAARIEPVDAQRAAALLVLAYYCSMMAGHADQARNDAERSLALAAAQGGPVAATAKSALGQTLALLGEVTQARALLDDIDPRELGDLVWGTGMAFMWLEEWDTARGLLEHAISAARSGVAPAALPFPLAALSELEFRTGSLARAYSAATESVDLAVVTGQEAILPYGLQALARVEAVLGHDAACRDHANAALTAAARSGLGSIEVYASAALGLLELGRGRTNEAIAPLETAARRARADGATQAAVQWVGDLIEAYIRSGRVSDAERLVDELAAESERTGQRWATACLARSRGMLAAETEFERFFEQALAIHGRDPSRFETARTELALGQRRRRARRRADARKALRSALASFEALGATPWAEQARSELRATGEAPTPSSQGSLRDLTPQELQVALIVAKGATNNETAAALFLSPKTVEFHLHNTYRKLAIRSRAELVRKVGLAAS